MEKQCKSSQDVCRQLFESGENSDVTITVNQHSWKLHKIFLKKSNYFLAMLSGPWQESQQDDITVHITDSDINFESVNTVFQSLYFEERIPVKNVTAICGAATFFQLEDLADSCEQLMLTNLNFETVVRYYYASVKYGRTIVKIASVNWMLLNLVPYMIGKYEQLKEIRMELLIDLIESAELFVNETEFSVYSLLLRWTYLQLDAEWKTAPKNNILDYLKEIAGEGTSFLTSDKGKFFEPAFRALKIEDLLKKRIDIYYVKKDNIIPHEWILTAMANQWDSIIMTDEAKTAGPEVVENLQLKTLTRYGKIIMDPGDKNWTWGNFEMGMTMEWSLKSQWIRVKRTQVPGHSLSNMAERRSCIYRLSVYSLDDERRVKHSQSTGFKSLKLYKNEMRKLIKLDAELTCPFFVAVNLRSSV